MFRPSASARSLGVLAAVSLGLVGLAAPAGATGNHGTSAAAGCPSGGGAFTSIGYSVNGRAVSDLRGQVREGDTVKATFTLTDACANQQVSLVSYTAPSASYSRESASQQRVSDSKTGTFSGGPVSLQVTVPSCWFQVDFVRGPVINQLGPASSNNFYGDQGRLMSADNGGTHSCTSQSQQTTPATSNSQGAKATAEACPAGNAAIKDVYYVIDGRRVSDLAGKVTEGASVTAVFTMASGCSTQVSLVSYTAPSASFSRETASQQRVFDSKTGTFSSGPSALQVKVPGCWFQVDFVRGPVINQLGPASSNNFYGDKLISADNGGAHSCSAATSQTTPSTTSSTTSTTSTTVAPTTTTTAAPTATTAAPASTNQVAAPAKVAPPKPKPTTTTTAPPMVRANGGAASAGEALGTTVTRAPAATPIVRAAFTTG